MNPKPNYLDETTLIGIIAHDWCLPNPYRNGYGRKIPTRYTVQLTDRRWRRVYVMQWSNAGSAYVLIKGVPYFLGAIDLAYKLKGAGIWCIS